MSNFDNKAKNLLKLSLSLAVASAFAAPANAADVPAANKQAEDAAKQQIINLNANFNSFETSKDYENFIQSRSKLLQRNAKDELKDVDVNAQPLEENAVLINKFNFLSEEGVDFPIISKLREEANKYSGQKFTARKIAALKNNLNNILIRAGYSTTIIYITDKGFSNDELTYNIKWGRVDNIRVNDEVQEKSYKDNLMLKTLPSFKDSVLKIDTVDQIVENLTTPNKSVRVDISATLNKSGYSDLAITPFRTKKPSFTLSFNNANAKDQVSLGLSASAGDLIGTNDTWNFSYNKRLDRDFQNSHTDILGLRLEQPFGYFSLTSNNTLISYKNTTASDVTKTKYKVYAPSFKTDEKLSYTAFRDKTRIVTVYGGFSFSNGKQDVRFVEDGKSIVFSTNRSSDVRLGATYLDNAFFGGRFFSEGYLTRSLSLFGSSKQANPGANNQPTEDATVFNFYSNYNKNFQVSNVNMNSTTTFSFQKSLSDKLAGYTTTYGDAYSVRGFREQTFTGDNGLLVSTNLGPVFSVNKQYVTSVNPYLGLDYALATTPEYNGSKSESYHAASVSVGVIVGGPSWRASLNVASPFAYEVPNKDKVKAVQTYFNVSYSF